MPTLSMGELAVQYGFAAAFFNSDPELKALIQAAVSGQWSPQKFQAKFMNTKWYRSREASVRQWADLTKRDPAEAKNKIFDRKLELADRFTQLGVQVSSAELERLASNSLQFSWSEAQMNNVLASYVKYTPGKMGGTAAALEVQIRQLADEYGLSATNNQVGDWIRGLVSETYTEDNITDFFKDMAKSKYAGMVGYLDKGMTVKQVAAPYLQSFSQILETGGDTVDMNDPLVQKALQGRPDDKGMPQMQTLFDFEKSLRKDPRWFKTHNARDSMTNAAMGIARDWGLVG